MVAFDMRRRNIFPNIIGVVILQTLLLLSQFLIGYEQLVEVFRLRLILLQLRVLDSDALFQDKVLVR